MAATRTHRWLPLVGGIAVAIGAGALIIQYVTSAPAPRSPLAETETDVAPVQRALPSMENRGALPDTKVPSEPVEPPAARVARIMEDWRLAIVNKNADTVQAVDNIFAARPREFIPALMASAERDPEERVRAFSTRVLGKLRPTESVELMRKLLTDRSEYVRFNAAWALGELSDREAVSRLRRLQKADPSAMVRRSAEESVRRMEGS